MFLPIFKVCTKFMNFFLLWWLDDFNIDLFQNEVIPLLMEPFIYNVMLWRKIVKSKQSPFYVGTINCFESFRRVINIYFLIKRPTNYVGHSLDVCIPWVMVASRTMRHTIFILSVTPRTAPAKQQQNNTINT